MSIKPAALSEDDQIFISSLKPTRGLVDCHIHLYADEFKDDLSDVILKANQAGVIAAITVAEGPENFERILELQKQYPEFVFPCLGFHPIQGDYNNAEKAKSLDESYLQQNHLDFIADHASKLSAIGEIGLDFTPKFTPNGSEDREKQKIALKKQIDLAQRLNLPINLHSRSAGKPLFDILLKDYPDQAAIFHAYAGKPGLVPIMCQKNENQYFSVGTNRLDISNPQTPKFIKSIPLKNMLLETDSPALGPIRGERNLPQNLTSVVEVIGNLRGLTVDQVRDITTNNAVRLFPKLAKIAFK